MNNLNLKLLKISLIASLIVSIGCERKEPQRLSPPTLASLKTDVVVLKVNDHVLTKGDVENYSNLRVAFYALMKPKVDKQQLEKVKKSTTAACLPYFIQNCVLSDAMSDFVRTGGVVTAEQREEVRSWLENQYVSRNKKYVRDFESLRGKLEKKGLSKVFDAEIETEIADELYVRVACSNRYSIEEFVITNVYTRWALNNYCATVTNRAILATATNVLKRIEAGDDFADLVYDYTMDPELDRGSGGDLGMCSFADFPGEEEIWEAVKDLNDGQTTGIVDAGDSWQILKVTGRDGSNPQELRLRLSRIYFRRAWVIDRPSRQEIVLALEEERRKNIIRETMAERLPKLKVEFPYGRELFGNIESGKKMLDVIDGKPESPINRSSGGK